MKSKIILLLSALLFASPVLAQEYSADLALESGSIRTPGYIIAGKTVTLYATVLNNSDKDLFGAVKFYDENRQQFIGADQTVSIVAGGTDDVFVDWQAGEVGDSPISVRVIPWEEAGDNPDNNKITTSIYVDLDSDGDGIPDRLDPDDDNDGVEDARDAFPYDPLESVDTDGDGVGNNQDTDDDGDGVSDIEDRFPTDGSETIDTDGDGVGDNSDAFPFDEKESKDSDHDGLGDNDDPNDENVGPVASIETESRLVSTGETVTFNALKSHDLDGDIVAYEWDFGEGVESTSVVVDHIFKKTGDHTVTLKVFDDDGEYRMTQLEVSVIYRWQTLILILLLVLLLVLFIYNLKNTKKALQKPKKKRKIS